MNTVQEWHLSTPDGTIGTVPHVFHIHVNPFQTYRQGPDGKDELVWLDTLGIPAGTLKSNPVKVWTHYVDFTGKSVFHCHVLLHEDAGMMQTIQIKEPKSTD